MTKLLSYGFMVSKVLSADVSHLELSKGVMVTKDLRVNVINLVLSDGETASNGLRVNLFDNVCFYGLALLSKIIQRLTESQRIIVWGFGK